MFSTPDQIVQGISAVKALQIAGQQGQRIYHITPANQAQTLPNLHLDELAMSEIRQALAAGREVITHADRISVPGWTGEGYILFDPISGDGAYKISGGANGSWTKVLELIQALLSYVAAFLSLLSELGGTLIDILNTAITVIDALLNCPSPHAQFIAGLAITFLVIGLLTAYIFAAVFTPLAGVLVAFAVGAGLGVWLDEYRNFRCR